MALFSASAAGKAPEALPMLKPFSRRCDGIAKDAHGFFLYAIVGGLLALSLWATFTELDKVKRGAGKVVPQMQNQTVQHLEGGIITEILVKEGDAVAKGAPLLRIQNSFQQAELQQARVELKAKRLRMARLDAEIAGKDAVAFPAELTEGISPIVDSERSLFRSRRATLREQLAIIDDQVRQKQIELSELQSRYANTKEERDLVLQRVQSIRKLAASGAVSRNELLDAERTLQQLESKISDLVHDIPRTDSALSEASRRGTETTLRFRADAEKERSDTELAIAKLKEGISAMAERSLRSEVVAPIDGIVNKLYATTIGGVVKSGEPLVLLVPSDSSIAVEARLSPADRAEVWPGQEAVVKISAYEYSVHGGLRGKVTDVSPDALTDERGQPYFRVRLEAQGSDFGKDKPVVPGMTAEVDILAGRHSVADYMLHPLRKLRDNALRQ